MTCFTPLSDSGEIRLLLLQPGHPEDPIQCELKHALRSEQPAYDALSYEWGPEEEKSAMQTITLNRTQHPVRKNLGLALHALRLTDEARILWVDALCINQGDDLERGHQVAQMGNIYRNAMMVRIWLGQAPRGAEDIITFLTNSGASWLRYANWLVTDWFATRTATMALLHNSYWERLWIIQEIVLAGEACIHFGTVVIDLASFQLAIYSNINLKNAPKAGSDLGSDLGSADVVLREFLTPFHIMDLPVTKILWQRANRWRPGPVASYSLASLMIEHLSARCADTRDKAFGLESLAYECCRNAVPVDYSVSLRVLWRQLLEHDIRVHKLDPAKIMKSARVISSSLCFKGGLSVKKLLNELGSSLHGLESVMNFGSSQGRQDGISLKLWPAGTVSWVSPPLRYILASEQPFKVPIEVLRSICYTDCLCQHRQLANEEWQSEVVHTIDGVWPLSTRAKSDPDALTPQCEDKNVSLVDIVQVETQDTRQIPGLEHLAYAFDHVMALLQLFRSASEKLRDDESQTADCVFFQASTSQSYIGIAPVGLRTGDLACLMEDITQAELMNESPIVIVSGVDRRITGVARSASRLYPMNNDTEQETGKVMVDAETDIMMLQLLAGLPSKTPKKE